MEKEYEQFLGKFYGNDKIRNVSKVISKTPKGADRVEVEFEGGTKKQLPLSQLVLLSSEKTIDPTTFRDKQMEPIVIEAISLLLEAEVPLEWLEFFSQKLGMSVSVSIDKANEVLWGKKFNDLTLLDIDRTLKLGSMEAVVEKK